MVLPREKSEQFTGLILLTGEDAQGLSNALFQALSPFSVSVIDLDQIIINKRLILTVQILLNPAHQGAIEEDLEALAVSTNVDIASVFSYSAALTPRPECATLSITSPKLHPRTLAILTGEIKKLGGNIESLERKGLEPIEIALHISGIDAPVLQGALAQISVESDVTIAVA
jgi:phosphoserine phosphatase